MNSRSFFTYFIFLTLSILAFIPTKDPDFFWHLETGKLIFESGFLNTDPFSYTKFGSSWYLHEWLSEVVIYSIYNKLGLVYVSMAFSFFILLTFIFVYKRCSEKPYVAGIATFFCAYVSGVCWGARPQIFNFLGASFFIYILDGIRRGEIGRKYYLILFAGLIVWVNLHSGAFLGALLIVYFSFLDLFRKNKGGVLGFVLLSVVSFSCLTINPEGFGAWFYPFETLFSSAMKEYIDEWHAPSLFLDTGRPFYLLIFVGFLLALLTRVLPAVSDLGLIVGSLVLALLSVRNIPFFCICFAPFFSGLLGQFFSRFGNLKFFIDPPRRVIGGGERVVFAVLLLVYSVFSCQKLSERILAFPEAINREYPVQAIDYLKPKSPHRIFNYYAWGGYLIHNNIPVFIDGRADMYGDEFFHEYADIVLLRTDPIEALKKYGIDYVIFPPNSPLIKALEESREFEEVYRDEVALVYLAN